MVHARARAHVCVPYMFWTYMYTAHRIKQPCMNKLLIVARMVDGFALKMIPVANIMEF